jgi:hypothetical protein
MCTQDPGARITIVGLLKENKEEMLKIVNLIMKPFSDIHHTRFFQIFLLNTPAVFY